ncbi:MAG: hypothetical protein JW757_14090 [Anaerolineales bacterium]|nr:hypothetical protein [Anaerolineales bacterium]
MKEKITAIVLSGLGGTLISYTAYFLVLQNLGINSLTRFSLVFALLILIAALLFLLFKSYDFNQTILKGILALFLFLNLIVSVKADYLDLPYTITLLPVQTIQLTPQNSQTPVTIRSYGTDLYADLNFDQISKQKGWSLNNYGHLTQTQGTAEPINWSGKPGQFIYFELASCSDCGSMQVESRGKTSSFPLDEASLPSGRLIYTFPSLAWHRILNFAALQGALLAFSALLIASARLIRVKTKPANAKADKFSFPRRIPTDLWLILFPLIIFGFKLSPVIFNDDWCQIIQPIHAGSFQFFDYAARRPMHLSLHWVISKIFPLHQAVIMMQVIQLAVIILIGLVIYRLLQKLLGDKDWLALLGALLCVVYPSDYTYFYLSLLGTRFAFLITLTAMLLFTRYLESNRIANVWASVVLVLAGLLIYEGQFGVYLVWPLVIGLIFSFNSLKDRTAGLAVYYLPALVFPVWRFGIQPLFYQDSKFGHLTEVFSGIIPSINWGFRTILGGFWPPYQDASWLTVKNYLILAAALIFCVLAYLAANQAAQANHPRKAAQQTQCNYRWQLAAGILLWAGGYFPIIINYPPNIWGHLSRVNIFTVPGAVLILSALLQIITTSLGWGQNASASAVNASMILLIFLGAAVHVQVQQSFIRSWQETKSFYQQVFNLAPDLEEGTQIYLYLHGEDGTQTTHRPLITTSWEPRCAFFVFYDSKVNQFAYSYQKITVPDFPGLSVLGGNIQDQYLPTLNPEHLLALSYDLGTKQVKVIEDISGYLGAGYQEKYHPLDLITPQEQENLSRRLID